MPRQYSLKNPYFRNARISAADTIYMVHMFLRGIKASLAAKEVGISEASGIKIYRKLRAVITGSGFGVDFSEILEEHEPMLHSLYQALRIFLINVDVPHDPELETAMEGEPEAVQMLFGIGRYCVTSGQLGDCIYRCDSDTPPLVIKKMAQAGKFNEVIEQRLSCKTCPLKLLAFYKPTRRRDKHMQAGDGSPFTFEPHYVYSDDKKELMVLWVEIMLYLADYRSLSDREFRHYAMQGAISRMLKRAEYKVKNISYGENVKPIFLDEAQKTELGKGFLYQSQLDSYVLDAILKRLEENPI